MLVLISSIIRRGASSDSSVLAAEGVRSTALCPGKDSERLDMECDQALEFVPPAFEGLLRGLIASRLPQAPSVPSMKVKASEISSEACHFFKQLRANFNETEYVSIFRSTLRCLAIEVRNRRNQAPTVASSLLLVHRTGTGLIRQDYVTVTPKPGSEQGTIDIQGPFDELAIKAIRCAFTTVDHYLLTRYPIPQSTTDSQFGRFDAAFGNKGKEPIKDDSLGLPLAIELMAQYLEKRGLKYKRTEGLLATGTVFGDGTIGPVGGIREKLTAVLWHESNRVDRVLIPSNEEDDNSDYKELNDLLRAGGIEITRVARLEDALQIAMEDPFVSWEARITKTPEQCKNTRSGWWIPRFRMSKSISGRRLLILRILLVVLLLDISFLGYLGYRNFQRGGLIRQIVTRLNPQPDSQNKTVILVTTIDGPEREKYRLTETILDQLNQATRKFSDISVQAAPETVTAQEGASRARQLGRERGASFVVWGWYTRTSERVITSVHFEPVNEVTMELNSAISDKSTPSYSGQPQALERFSLQLDTSNEIAYLALLIAGYERLTNNDDVGAIERFNEAARQAPPQASKSEAAALLFFCRGLAHHDKKDYDSALKDYTAGIESGAVGSRGAGLYMNRGVVYDHLKEYSKALSDYDQAIHLDDKDGKAFFNRATLRIAMATAGSLIDRAAVQIAIRDLTRAIELSTAKNADRADYLWYRGSAYLMVPEPDKAIQDFTGVIKIEPNETRALRSRALAYQMTGQDTRAMRDINNAIQKKPTAELYRVRAQIHLDNKQKAEGLNDLRTAISIDPQYPASYLDRAKLYLEGNQTKSAIADLTFAIKLKPDDPDLYEARAEGFLKDGQSDAALDDYATLIRLEPKKTTWYRDRASLISTLASKGDEHYRKMLTMAINDCTKALEFPQSNLSKADLYGNRAIAYLNNHDAKRALDDLNAALSLAPDDEGYFLRGCALLLIHGNFEASKKDLLMGCLPLGFVSLNEQDVADMNAAAKRGEGNALEARLLYLISTARFQEAFRDCDAVVKTQPFDLFFLRMRAVLESVQNPTRRPESDIKRLLAIEDSKDVRLAGGILLLTSDPSQAMAELEQARSMSKGDYKPAYLIDCLSKSGLMSKIEKREPLVPTPRTKLRAAPQMSIIGQQVDGTVTGSLNTSVVITSPAQGAWLELTLTRALPIMDPRNWTAG